jgi:hypothetical protein
MIHGQTGFLPDSSRSIRCSTVSVSMQAISRIIGLARLIRHEIRRDGLNREDGRKLIETCRSMLAQLLPRTDSLVF